MAEVQSNVTSMSAVTRNVINRRDIGFRILRFLIRGRIRITDGRGQRAVLGQQEEVIPIIAEIPGLGGCNGGVIGLA